ncbi:hypothetical protein PanWU01x14_273370, partial [Parasponia andersonii]
SEGVKNYNRVEREPYSSERQMERARKMGFIWLEEEIRRARVLSGLRKKK